jgi:acetyl-CoA carboxylase biotin carboxyl carrier protein
MIDFTFIERLLELLNSSQAGSIEVRKNWFSTTVRVSKDPHFGNAGGGVTYQVGAPPQSSRSPAAPALPESGRAGEASAVPDVGGAGEGKESLVEIKSPMVGTFYAQPEPGADPYVRVGTRIAPGHTLCIIEAMKIMNPIDAEISGVIGEICVQDAQPVEYGQVLFRVDPNG